MPGAPELEPVPFTELLVAFAGELRAAGLAVGSGDILVYCSALSKLDPADLVDLYWAGRTTLVNRRDDIALYDQVFRRFLDDLEQCVEARGGDHVRFVDDEDSVPRLCRCVEGPVT